MIPNAIDERLRSKMLHLVLKIQWEIAVEKTTSAISVNRPDAPVIWGKVFDDVIQKRRISGRGWVKEEDKYLFSQQTQCR